MREIRTSGFDERGVETGLWHEEEIGHRQSETGGNRDISLVVTAPHLDSTCAVQRRCFPAGANPARQLSLQPVATGAVVEVTKRLKPLA